MISYIYALKNANSFSLFLKEDKEELLFGSLVLAQICLSINLYGTKKAKKTIITIVKTL